MWTVHSSDEVSLNEAINESGRTTSCERELACEFTHGEATAGTSEKVNQGLIDGQAESSGGDEVLVKCF